MSNEYPSGMEEEQDILRLAVHKITGSLHKNDGIIIIFTGLLFPFTSKWPNLKLIVGYGLICSSLLFTSAMPTLIDFYISIKMSSLNVTYLVIILSAVLWLLIVLLTGKVSTVR